MRNTENFEDVNLYSDSEDMNITRIDLKKSVESLPPRERQVIILRYYRDMTQQQVAEYLHMKREVYRRYESGEREIPVWALIQLAELYNTSTDYILGRTNQREPVK